MIIKPTGDALNDTNLLDWFEHIGGICGAALINDDNGHWAVSATGMQSAAVGEDPMRVCTTFLIEANEWRDSIREAILAFAESYDD